MHKLSNQNLIKCARLSAPLMLIVAFLPACSNLSEMVKSASGQGSPQMSVAAAPEKVSVQVNQQPAANLPDIPDEIKKCLAKRAEKANASTSADDTVKALYAADKTKSDCAGKLFRWYKQRQDDTAKTVTAEKLPDGHPKSGKPAATW